MVAAMTPLDLEAIRERAEAGYPGYDLPSDAVENVMGEDIDALIAEVERLAPMEKERDMWKVRALDAEASVRANERRSRRATQAALSPENTKEENNDA
jgi:hypothetical protein